MKPFKTVNIAIAAGALAFTVLVGAAALDQTHAQTSGTGPPGSVGGPSNGPGGTSSHGGGHSGKNWISPAELRRQYKIWRSKQRKCRGNDCRVVKRTPPPKIAVNNIPKPPKRVFISKLPTPKPNDGASNGMPPAGEDRFRPDELVVVFGPGVSPNAIAAFQAAQGLTTIRSHRINLVGAQVHQFRIANGQNVPDAIRALQELQQVAFVQPNYLYSLQDQQTAGSSGAAISQYAIERLNLQPAHALAKGARVRIAVIDSAVDYNHTELNGTIANRFDAVSSADLSAHSHGTAIAGVIAAHARLLGVAPSATILSIRAFAPDPNGGIAQGTTYDVIRGLDWAISNRARIVNMSFAGPRDPMLAQALKEARSRGVILIAAAGNAGADSPPLYPAADESVLAVTATDNQDGLFKAANRGNYISIAAPGVDILTLAPDNGYQILSGTSLAAAHVSGLAALLLERNPKLDPEGVANILVLASADLGKPGHDKEFGAGLPDAMAAVSNVKAKLASQ